MTYHDQEIHVRILGGGEEYAAHFNCLEFFRSVDGMKQDPISPNDRRRWEKLMPLVRRGGWYGLVVIYNDSIQKRMVEQRLGHTLMETFDARLITGSVRLQ